LEVGFLDVAFGSWFLGSWELTRIGVCPRWLTG
jgi:hypothetical protein